MTFIKKIIDLFSILIFNGLFILLSIYYYQLAKNESAFTNLSSTFEITFFTISFVLSLFIFLYFKFNKKLLICLTFSIIYFIYYLLILLNNSISISGKFVSISVNSSFLYDSIVEINVGGKTLETTFDNPIQVNEMDIWIETGVFGLQNYTNKVKYRMNKSCSITYDTTSTYDFLSYSADESVYQRCFHSALKEYDQIRIKYPNRYETNLKIGLIYLSLKQYGKALDYFYGGISLRYPNLKNVKRIDYQLTDNIFLNEISEKTALDRLVYSLDFKELQMLTEYCKKRM